MPLRGLWLFRGHSFQPGECKAHAGTPQQFSACDSHYCLILTGLSGARNHPVWSLISERHAQYDRFYQGLSVVVLFLNFGHDGVNSARVFQRQSATKSITQHLVREIPQEEILAFEQCSLQFSRAIDMCAVRQFSRRVDGLPCLFRPPSTDDVVVVEREADRINAAVTTGAHRVLPVLRKSLADRFRSRSVMIAPPASEH